MSFFGFAKKKNHKTDSHSERKKDQDSVGHPGSNPSVKVLGSGCSQCNQLEEAVSQALEELGLDIEIDHIRDFEEIARYGVMATPALVLGDKLLSTGKVLKKKEALKLLQKEGL